MKIRRAIFEEIKHLRGKAGKEKVSMANPPESEWWVAEQEGGTIIGFACGVKKGSSVRFKSAWVDPNYRGVKIYSMLFQVRWNHYTVLKDVKRITAYCTNMSIGQFQKHGFQAISRNAHGSMYMVRDLKQKGVETK